MAEEEVTPPEGVATVGELLSWLEGRGPNFAAAFSDRRAIRVAENQAYAQPGDPVRAGDEVAIFAPVNGGERAMIHVQQEDFEVSQELEKLNADNHAIGGAADFVGRSEERRGGKEGGSKVRSRWWAVH